MSAEVHQKATSVTAWGNVALMLAAAAAGGYGWLRTGAIAYLIFAASWTLRAPVAFNHPRTWEELNHRKRFNSPSAFSLSDSLLSIVSFLLLIVSILMILADGWSRWRGGGV
jgi:hypothetical protein